MKRALSTAAAVLVGVGVVLMAQDARRDGRWQVSVEMNMPGMPAGMPPMSLEHCITKEEADNPTALMPRGPGRGNTQQDCKVSDQKISGNTVSWSMTCTTPQEMSGTGEFVYGSDTFEGVMKMTMQGQTMTMKYSGKRLGDCVK